LDDDRDSKEPTVEQPRSMLHASGVARLFDIGAARAESPSQSTTPGRYVPGFHRDDIVLMRSAF